MDIRMIGRRLRTARITAGFENPEYFATEIEVPPDKYLRIESGEEPPDLETMADVARLTGRSLDFLVFGKPGSQKGA